MSEMKDTMLGLLRRTGPDTAELLDPETGEVYGMDFGAACERIGPGFYTGPELTDLMFHGSVDE